MKRIVNTHLRLHVNSESGEKLSYMPVPDDVRLCFASITRFYLTEEGQKIITDKLDEIKQSIEKWNKEKQAN